MASRIGGVRRAECWPLAMLIVVMAITLHRGQI